MKKMRIKDVSMVLLDRIAIGAIQFFAATRATIRCVGGERWICRPLRRFSLLRGFAHELLNQDCWEAANRARVCTFANEKP